MLTDTRACIILDGGLGTTVEELDSDATHHPLWSGKLLADNPGLLLMTHMRFLEAGADVIETATYQGSLETFSRAGYTQEEARVLMLSAITVAEDAIKRFEQSSAARRRPLIALSLGPFGAQITQEYGGIYPPPYGPSTGRNGTATGSTFFDSPEDELSAELALADWHFQRLRIFADSPEHWKLLSFIAFETIPLLREGRGIRRAMAQLKELVVMKGLPWHPWWISFVYPGGDFPEAKPGGARILPEEIARRITEPAQEGVAIAAVPDGIGINCTNLRHLQDIVTGYAIGLAQTSIRATPFLVLYPDGGFNYDPYSKVWQEDGTRFGDGEGGDIEVKRSESWGVSLAQLGRNVVRMTRDGTSVWSRIFLGGCCKAAAQDIRVLKNACHEFLLL